MMVSGETARSYSIGPVYERKLDQFSSSYICRYGRALPSIQPRPMQCNAYAGREADLIGQESTEIRNCWSFWVAAAADNLNSRLDVVGRSISNC